MSQKKRKTSKTVKTAFGIVSRPALEDLQNTFDTTNLLRAVDAIDQVRYRDDDLRKSVLTLHQMAMNLINQNYGTGTTSEESIGELANSFGSWRQPSKACAERRLALPRRRRCGKIMDSRRMAP